jgi:hypothetical protein
VAGQDNRWDVLHPARFLPGASCSAKAIWLAAREVLGNTGHQALSSYDMGAWDSGAVSQTRAGLS